MGNIDKKVLILDKLDNAKVIVDLFEENYTEVVKSSDSSMFMVAIKPMDRHKLTQEQRDSMVELPKDFYKTIE